MRWVDERDIVKYRRYTIREVSDGDKWYAFIHTKRRTVAILPYRNTDQGVEYLIRQDLVPAWGEGNYPVSVTGGIDKGKVPEVDLNQHCALIDKMGASDRFKNSLRVQRVA